MLIPINRGDRRVPNRVSYSQADEHVAQDAEKKGMVVRQAGLVGGQFDRDWLFTFTKLPASQWKSARTTNAIERLHEEFKRRIKTQTVLPSAEPRP